MSAAEDALMVDLWADVRRMLSERLRTLGPEGAIAVVEYLQEELAAYAEGFYGYGARKEDE